MHRAVSCWEKKINAFALNNMKAGNSSYMEKVQSGSKRRVRQYLDFIVSSTALCHLKTRLKLNQQKKNFFVLRIEIKDTMKLIDEDSGQ